jgi:hypothetical protein
MQHTVMLEGPGNTARGADSLLLADNTSAEARLQKNGDEGTIRAIIGDREGSSDGVSSEELSGEDVRLSS